MALDTRYDVIIHVDSSIPDDRLPRILSRDIDHRGIDDLDERRKHNREGDDPFIHEK